MAAVDIENDICCFEWRVDFVETPADQKKKKKTCTRPRAASLKSGKMFAWLSLSDNRERERNDGVISEA